MRYEYFSEKTNYIKISEEDFKSHKFRKLPDNSPGKKCICGMYLIELSNRMLIYNKLYHFRENHACLLSEEGHLVADIID